MVFNIRICINKCQTSLVPTITITNYVNFSSLTEIFSFTCLLSQYVVLLVNYKHKFKTPLYVGTQVLSTSMPCSSQHLYVWLHFRLSFSVLYYSTYKD